MHSSVHESLSLQCMRHYHFSAWDTITSVHESLSLQCMRHYHFSAWVTITPVHETLSLQCMSHYHFSAWDTITSVHETLSLQCMRHYHFSAWDTIIWALAKRNRADFPHTQVWRPKILSSSGSLFELIIGDADVCSMWGWLSNKYICSTGNIVWHMGAKNASGVSLVSLFRVIYIYHGVILLELLVSAGELLVSAGETHNLKCHHSRFLHIIFFIIINILVTLLHVWKN